MVINMNITMKKITAAILVFDILAGLLLLFTYTNKQDVGMNITSGSIREPGVESQIVEVIEADGDLVVEDFSVIADERVDEKKIEQKKIALTFDDGPHPFYTEQLLDGLKERGVVATFFVIGEHAVLHPDIIKRMQEEGHLIGNHTYSHMQLSSKNKEEFKEELIATSEVIEEIIDEEVIYVRPPYGTWDKSFENELNMIPVLWTIDPLDWCSSNAACVVSKVVEKAEENDIILMHDYYESSVTAALEVVDQLREEGFTFVTVEEILFD